MCTACRGVYAAPRASALAGVPLSTLYEWARERVVTPSVSAERVKFWSWSDLVAARAVYWLRHPAGDRPATSMKHIRTLTERIESEDVSLGEALASEKVLLLVDPAGVPHVRTDGFLTEAQSGWQQRVSEELMTDILDPFSIQPGVVGPHLLSPAEGIRIVPGKLSGEPHVQDTRIETRVLSALWDRGFRLPQLAEFYPATSMATIKHAIGLERQLRRNESKLAA